MTIPDTAPRTLLTLLQSGPHGSRSHLTCLYRCGNACAMPIPNESDNPEFRDVAARALARRSVLKAGATLGVLSFATAATTVPAAAAPGGAPVRGPRGGAGSWAFASVLPNKADAITVPAGFTSRVVIRWGDPVTRFAPVFDVYRQSPEAAQEQFGYNNDYVGVLPHPRHRDHALLVVNHEYTDEELMYPAGVYDPTTITKIAMASHGMSVVEIRRSPGRETGAWEQVNVRSTKLNRRIHVGTEFDLVGPAAGTERLRTSADPSGRRVLGTFNNCAGGLTPWGTVLSGEENFNGYFDASGALDPTWAASYKRYGITGAGRGWKDVDPRFDLTTTPTEPFRHGWIVELDPYDPTSTPRKHTMLGRMKHEGANVTISASGHAVVYMGDDERGDYIYKFVSRERYDAGTSDAARGRNLDLLTAGTLYVARFTGDGTADGVNDGTGEWLRLADESTSYVTGMTLSDVLIDTRLAADRVAPTRMDRPEDVEVNPVNGKVYAALTNNRDRGKTFPVDEPNPLASSMVRASFDAPLTSASGNRNGYVLEMTPDRGDHTATTFTWDLMLVCGDPAAGETYFAGYPKQLVSPISCPDNVAFDAVGNLWISTDGNVLGSNDGLFRVPVAGPERGKVSQFLTVPLGAETCGPFITDDQQSVFVAVQHPGEVTGATFETPASIWPDGRSFPRPSVVVAYRA